MYTIARYFAGFFPGKVQKIAVNAGLGCPNRDGTIGSGGCIYCNNAAFNPRYAYENGMDPLGDAVPGSITRQLQKGVEFFATKGTPYAYLAYFQSYTNTYGPTDKLIALYEEALSFPGVAGLVIATRPDCLAPDLLDYFQRRFGNLAPQSGKPFLLVELGIESTNDETLRRINRGHDFASAVEAADQLHSRGIQLGAHLILGLPGETHQDFMAHARRISQLPVSTLKLHQLQVIKGTQLERMYAADPSAFHLFTPQEYAAVVKDFVACLRPDIALDRFVSESPKSLLVAPAWGLNPNEFSKLLD